MGWCGGGQSSNQRPRHICKYLINVFPYSPSADLRQLPPLDTWVVVVLGCSYHNYRDPLPLPLSLSPWTFSIHVEQTVREETETQETFFRYLVDEIQ